MSLINAPPIMVGLMREMKVIEVLKEGRIRYRHFQRVFNNRDERSLRNRLERLGIPFKIRDRRFKGQVFAHDFYINDVI